MRVPRPFSYLVPINITYEAAIACLFVPIAYEIADPIFDYLGYPRHIYPSESILRRTWALMIMLSCVMTISIAYRALRRRQAGKAPLSVALYAFIVGFFFVVYESVAFSSPMRISRVLYAGTFMSVYMFVIPALIWLALMTVPFGIYKLSQRISGTLKTENVFLSRPLSPAVAWVLFIAASVLLYRPVFIQALGFLYCRVL